MNTKLSIEDTENTNQAAPSVQPGHQRRSGVSTNPQNPDPLQNQNVTDNVTDAKNVNP